MPQFDPTALAVVIALEASRQRGLPQVPPGHFGKQISCVGYAAAECSKLGSQNNQQPTVLRDFHHPLRAHVALSGAGARFRFRR